MRRALLTITLGALALVAFPTAAAADLADEQALAERYAPVVRLVEQLEECGPGEPFLPLDVEVLFSEPTVALLGPWNAVSVIEIGPEGQDLVDLFEYHLDFPGNALDPECDYELWHRRLTGSGHTPTVYAHVATDPGHPGKLALQYWFFYIFNDFNNTHEGDWEMIQLNFDAGDAREALEEGPVEAGYSSHEGAERAIWGEDDKLEIVDGTHPVVYPAAGSHANKYTESLYLGSSAEAGVGCDDTRGPHVELRPKVATIPSDPVAARSMFPWITFEGRWGELQTAFFNGPTGPSLKDQWTAPIEWAEDWRDRSYGVPTGGLFGTRATDFFCSGVSAGSVGLIRLVRNPVPMLLLIAAVLGLVVFAAVRATWSPATPLRLARRRSGGQVLAASTRMYASRALLFIGIGLPLIPIALAITALQIAQVGAIDLVGRATGEDAGASAYVALAIGTTLNVFGLALVQAATACALVEIDAGREIGALGAYRRALRRSKPLLAGIAIFALVWVALTTTIFLVPFALWLAVRWSLLAPVVEIEDRSGRGALRRSRELVRGRWWKVGSLVGLSGLIAAALGPLIGAILIFTTGLPLRFLNVVAGVVYALGMPFVALVTSYAYFDARARHELEPVERRDELPAEVLLDRP